MKSSGNHGYEDEESHGIDSQADGVEYLDDPSLVPAQPVGLALGEPRQCRIELALVDHEGEEWQDA